MDGTLMTHRTGCKPGLGARARPRHRTVGTQKPHRREMCDVWFLLQHEKSQLWAGATPPLEGDGFPGLSA